MAGFIASRVFGLVIATSLGVVSLLVLPLPQWVDPSVVKAVLPTYVQGMVLAFRLHSFEGSPVLWLSLFLLAAHALARFFVTAGRGHVDRKMAVGGAVVFLGVAVVLLLRATLGHFGPPWTRRVDANDLVVSREGAGDGKVKAQRVARSVPYALNDSRAGRTVVFGTVGRRPYALEKGPRGLAVYLSSARLSGAHHSKDQARDSWLVDPRSPDGSDFCGVPPHRRMASRGALLVLALMLGGLVATMAAVGSLRTSVFAALCAVLLVFPLWGPVADPSFPLVNRGAPLKYLLSVSREGDVGLWLAALHVRLPVNHIGVLTTASAILLGLAALLGVRRSRRGPHVLLVVSGGLASILAAIVILVATFLGLGVPHGQELSSLLNASLLPRVPMEFSVLGAGLPPDVVPRLYWPSALAVATVLACAGVGALLSVRACEPSVRIRGRLTLACVAAGVLVAVAVGGLDVFPQGPLADASGVTALAALAVAGVGTMGLGAQLDDGASALLLVALFLDVSAIFGG